MSDAGLIRSPVTASTSQSAPAVRPFDGLPPRECTRIESLKELRESLLEASNADTPLAFVGCGRHLSIGNTPSRLERTLDMQAMDRILAYEPADMTITAEAGVTLETLQSTLRDHGQFVPLDPWPDDAVTIGGLLSANVSGPLRHRYGTGRDWLLGLRAVLADGSIIKSGGKVVKNVSGYDLHKVFVGALGTLGAIAEVTLKVAPLPRVDRTFAISTSSAAEAAGVIMSAHEAGLAIIAAELLSPTAASVLTGAVSWTALVRVGGGQAATGRTTDDLHELTALAHGAIEELDAAVWTSWRAHFAPGTLGLRVSVMPARSGELAESLDRAFAGDAAHTSATVSAGLVRLNLAPRDDAMCAQLVARAQEFAHRRGGFVVVDSAPLAFKRTNDVFGPPRPDLEIMRRLKQQFDPAGILSPGRIQGRI